MTGGGAPPEIRVEDDVVIASLPDEIDLSNAGQLLRMIAAAVPNDAVGVVLDLSETTYLDSSGVHLVFDLAARLATRQQGLALCVPEGSHIRRVLELVDVGVAAPLESDLAKAKGRARSRD